jgi:uncharacterized membrane protein YkvA (DUF1232 family)
VKTLSVLIPTLIRSNRIGRAAALLPLLGTQNFRQLARDASLIFSHFVSRKATKKEMALLAGTILFLLSPVTAIPIIGIVDDVIVITLVLRYLHKKALESQESY